MFRKKHLSTLIDSLKLNMRNVDDLFPPMKEMMGSFGKIPNLPPDLDGRDKMGAWLTTLNQMAADDTLSDAQSRQFTMDLEVFYAAFYKWLKNRN